MQIDNQGMAVEATTRRGMEIIPATKAGRNKNQRNIKHTKPKITTAFSTALELTQEEKDILSKKVEKEVIEEGESTKTTRRAKKESTVQLCL